MNAFVRGLKVGRTPALRAPLRRLIEHTNIRNTPSRRRTKASRFSQLRVDYWPRWSVNGWTHEWSITDRPACLPASQHALIIGAAVSRTRLFRTRTSRVFTNCAPQKPRRRHQIMQIARPLDSTSYLREFVIFIFIADFFSRVFGHNYSSLTYVQNIGEKLLAAAIYGRCMWRDRDLYLREIDQLKRRHRVQDFNQQAVGATLSQTTSQIEQSLFSASYVSCQRDTARVCCWAPYCGAAAAGRPASPLSIDIPRTPLSSKPAARRSCGWMMGQTDRRTDARAFHRPCSVCEQ